MKKLLNKPLRAFVIYSFIILLCSVPAYYFNIDFIWRNELDEHNQMVGEKIKQNLESIGNNDSIQNAIEIWNKLQPEAKIIATNLVRKDSTYNVYRRNTYLAEQPLDRFQGLVTYFKINNKSYSLTIETNVEETSETMAAITTITVFFFLLLLLGLILLNRRISKKLWKPFYNTLGKIKEYDLESANKPGFEKTDIIEFAELNANLDQLLDRNAKVYSEQKKFTENASHELQTPLAIVQSKLDLLLQSESLSLDQSQVIDQANKALSRVTRINKNLVLLARISNHQFKDDEKIDISQLLKDLLELLSDHISSKNIQVETEILDGVAQTGNKMLLETVFTNLLLNAIRHNGPNGLISVRLDAQHFLVGNSGTAMLNEEQLFKRFSSASSHTPGSGLGLSIIKEICDRYHWKINYRFNDSFHFFEIWF